MTREEAAKAIRWDIVVWIAGLVNVGAMLPQLYKIITTRNVVGLSIEMFITFLFLQVAFSLQGFFRRDNMLMISMGLSSIVTATIIGFILYLRP